MGFGNPVQPVAFQAAFDLLPSFRPGVCQTLSSLYILESRLGLLDDEGSGYLINSLANPFPSWDVTTRVFAC